MTTIEELRKAVQDEGLPLAKRCEAAEHLVKLKAKAVPTVPPDDPEVLALTAMWPRETPEQASLAAIFSTYSNGLALDEALTTVQARHILRSQLADVLDASLPELERLETVRAILAGLPEGHVFRLSGKTPEHLLSTLSGPTDTRQYSLGNCRFEYRPVSRPPERLDDVWSPRRA